jgi:hypothetical protein
MSSFICGAKHFNSIEKGLSELINLDGSFYIPYELKKDFPVLYHNTLNSKETVNKEIKRVVDELRTLNVLCVCLQYKSHYEGVLDDEIKTQTEIVFSDKTSKYLTPHGLYNALCCVNYQIEIEHLKEISGLTPSMEKSMFFLKTMINALAHYLVSKMPESKSNNWEVD